MAMFGKLSGSARKAAQGAKYWAAGRIIPRSARTAAEGINRLIGESIGAHSPEFDHYRNTLTIRLAEGHGINEQGLAAIANIARKHIPDLGKAAIALKQSQIAIKHADPVRMRQLQKALLGIHLKAQKQKERGERKQPHAKK